MNKYSKILTDNIFLNKVFEMISIQENKIQCLFEKKPTLHVIQMNENKYNQYNITYNNLKYRFIKILSVDNSLKCQWEMRFIKLYKKLHYSNFFSESGYVCPSFKLQINI